MVSGVLVLTTLFVHLVLGGGQPNILFILTDDQDIEIGGEIPIVKTRKHIGEEGITFKNAYATSPLCCPSRASILTGRYVHNHHAINNSKAGNCSSELWEREIEPQAFAPILKKQGYKTFFAGKYLNQYGDNKAGGLTHIPLGWDSWYALHGNSKYYNYTVSNNGYGEVRGDSYRNDYLTDRIGRKAVYFMELTTMPDDPPPFFMMLSLPAPHAPFIPAPQYKNKFSQVKVQSGGSFNTKQQDKHWLMRQVIHPMTDHELEYIQEAYVKRWRTLLSVDDLVENLVTTLEDLSLLNNTYIFYTSDNGFHLGQFSLPRGKRQLYEFDIRVPSYVRGPGIEAGQIRQELILNIDYAPTFIELAGGQPPPSMDGKSMKSLLLYKPQEHENPQWRVDFLVEHSGEHHDVDPNCPQFFDQELASCYPSCVCGDSMNNSYSCVRTKNDSQNLMYCEFEDKENFIEAYDLDKDPYQLQNIVTTMNKDLLAKLGSRLQDLKACQGTECQSVFTPSTPPPTLGYKLLD